MAVRPSKLRQLTFLVCLFLLEIAWTEGLNSDFPGCVDLDASGRLDCLPTRLEERMGCSSIRAVSESFKALTPSLPIVECRSADFDHSANAVLYKDSGWLSAKINYIVFQDSKPRLLDSPESFRNTFAPVETAEEALAFALALTPAYSLDTVDIPDGYIRLAQVIEPTNVKRSGDGFIVHLFNYRSQGCKLHPYYFVDYYVGKDGFVTEIKREDVYRNPKDDNVCAD